MNSNFPSCTPLDADKTKEMLRLWKGIKNGWVQVGEKKFVLLSRYAEVGPNYYNFKGRPTDIWVLSFPRSGTHWTVEMVWLLSNNLDFVTANEKRCSDRYHFLGTMMFLNPELPKRILECIEGTVPENVKRPDYEILDALDSPRYLYSHFPLSLLPNVINSGCKIVYVARNPKDVAVSWYFLNKDLVMTEYVGDFSKFWKYFKNDLIIWTPYWEHLKEAWAHKDDPNFLFIFYEEMQADLFSVVKKVSSFLGKVYSDEELSKLVDNLDFKNFKNNPMREPRMLKDGGIFLRGGSFMREGKSGNWKSTFTEELEKEADEWIAENLKDTDLVFPMEIVKGKNHFCPVRKTVHQIPEQDEKNFNQLRKLSGLDSSSESD